jgi:hypothetical protein
LVIKQLHRRSPIFFDKNYILVKFIIWPESLGSNHASSNKNWVEGDQDSLGVQKP